MSVASGSSVQGPSNVRYRGASSQLGYLTNSDPKCFISSRHGPSLQSTALEEVCIVLMKLEFELVNNAHAILEKIVQQNNAETPEQTVKARHDVHELKEIYSQMQDVMTGRYQFHEEYPKDRYLIPYWYMSLNLLCQFVDTTNSVGLEWAGNGMRLIEQASLELRDRLVEAASQGELPPEVRRAIRDKWLKLEDRLALYRQKIGTDIQCPKWIELSRQLNEAQRNAPPVVTPVPRATPAKDKESSATLDLILWLTFAGTTLISVPSLGMAIKYSTSERGKITDADFWFLLQVSSFQFCGLLVTGLTLWKDASRWNWAPIGLALLATVAGPTLYCFTPSFFGVVSNTLAGFVQAFVVLRGAIAERSK